MSRIAIDIGCSNCHLAVEERGRLVQTQTHPMEVAVLDNRMIVAGKGARKYADSAEYVLCPLMEMNEYVSVNECSYRDIMDAYLSMVKKSVGNVHSVIHEVILLTAFQLSPIDPRYTILSESVKNVFGTIPFTFMTTAEAAANYYRHLNRHERAENIIVLDVGTQMSVCSLVQYDDRNNRQFFCSNEKCVGSSYIEEKILRKRFPNEQCYSCSTEQWNQIIREKESSLSSVQDDYALFVSQLINHCIQLLSLLQLDPASVNTILLVGNNCKSPIIQREICNQFFIRTAVRVEIEKNDNWNYSYAPVMGAILPDLLSIRSVTVNNQECQLLLGDNYFGSDAACQHVIKGVNSVMPRHFNVNVKQVEKSYEYTIIAMDGPVYIGMTALGNESWQLHNYTLDNNTQTWKAGGLLFTLV